MPPRALITTAPFGVVDPRPLALLREAALPYSVNPHGRRLTEAELADLARDVTILIAGTEPITARVMDQAPHVGLIARVGIGLDNVDLHAARNRGIAVAYTPDAPAPAVAELTLGFMLSLLRHVPQADRAMRDNRWHRFMGRRLDGLTVGVVGVGRVGSRVIRLVKSAFPGSSILAHDIAPDTACGSRFDVRWVALDELLSRSDMTTVHVPLTTRTRHLIGSRELALMPRDACFINTARGGVVDEAALAVALREERLAGAAVDVFEHEPYTGELAHLDRCVVTCHMGAMSVDCRARMEIEAVEEAVRWASGAPLKQPVPEAEYAL